MKKSLKKGGVGDVVTLIIIIGLALALIVAVVVPMINNSNVTGQTAATDMGEIDDNIAAISEVTF